MADRRVAMPGTLAHYIEVDAVHSLMERSPGHARAGVVVGGVTFVGTLLWLVLGLFGVL